MIRRVDERLREVDQAGEADDGSVDAAESCEAKDFGGVVGHGGVVKGPQEDEEDHVGVGGPHEGKRAQDANGGDEGHKGGEHPGCADVVQ